MYVYFKQIICKCFYHTHKSSYISIVYAIIPANQHKTYAIEMYDDWISNNHSEQSNQTTIKQLTLLHLIDAIRARNDAYMMPW